MAKNDNLKDFLVDVADAIREKEGSSEPINPQEFSDRIRAIQGGGGNENLYGYTGHADEEGLRAIGWDDDDIEYFKQHGIKWNEDEDDLYKVSDDNKALYGVLTAENIQDYKDRIVYLPKINLSVLKSITALFKECVNMIGVPLLNTKGFPAMTNMFHTCRSLTYIPPMDTSSVTAMGNFCYSCYSLTDLPMLDTSKVIDFSGAFFGCYSLRKMPPWDFGAATTTYRTFYGAASLTDLPDLNLISLVSGGRTCYNCYCLKNVGQVNFGPSATLSEFFYLNAALTDISIVGLSSSISFAESPLLNKDSLKIAIDLSYNVNNIVITLHPYAYQRLVEDADIVASLSEHPNVTLASA